MVISKFRSYLIILNIKCNLQYCKHPMVEQSSLLGQFSCSRIGLGVRAILSYFSVKVYIRYPKSLIYIITICELRLVRYNFNIAKARDMHRKFVNCTGQGWRQAPGIAIVAPVAASTMHVQNCHHIHPAFARPVVQIFL